MMIPKVIHYCWFGGKPLPEDVKRYIKTWKKYCPDYEIKEWNESNFDVKQNQYCREAYEAKKWAFVSDYVRLKVLYDYGGIYMDTDVEVCKPLDDLLSYSFLSGFETENQIQTGVVAAGLDNKLVSYLLSYYAEKDFKNKDGSYDMTTNVITITKMLKDKYHIKLNNTFQIFGDNNAIFPLEYFCAKDFFSGKVLKTENTYTIHHFNGSWLTPLQISKLKIKKFLVKVIGSEFVEDMKKWMNKKRVRHR
ncbi:glycosyltransferase family 32 protein [Phascolarctobacterium faecium]|uniref:glycosyltransferase family 32 protein n=1 Tax=Phascolarctobacterium faecium TaxID=33025 RepID=UPI00210BA6F6|nr:glycosyltransferase [Phascolarctobacterium faecium]MCQ5184593.1 glycosyl transferase [Phascolarctobacterium faecium]